ncbi:MAG: hypothetical protein E7577_07870 [Ruminococcaceae bacterium]|nr:hypothetical protein [Oscillospiraceae bacterium]
MNTELLKICGIALLCAFIGGALGRTLGGMSVAVRLGGLALIFGGILGSVGEIVGQLSDMGLNSTSLEYSELMLRGLAIGVLCRICSDVCRDCGEPTVAAGVESAGKLAILALAMPVLADIVEYAAELVESI